MSLTRDEWQKMWDSLRKIEFASKDLISTKIEFQNRRHYSNLILKEIRAIKEQVQSVVGQME